MTNARFSIWLMPPAPMRARFSEIIRRLSRRLGTPTFDPHVTLCGGPLNTDESELAVRAEELAARLAPVPIRLTDIGYTEEYFRCLFVRAERTAELLDARRAACKLLRIARGGE